MSCFPLLSSLLFLCRCSGNFSHIVTSITVHTSSPAKTQEGGGEDSLLIKEKKKNKKKKGKGRFDTIMEKH